MERSIPDKPANENRRSTGHRKPSILYMRCYRSGKEVRTDQGRIAGKMNMFHRATIRIFRAGNRVPFAILNDI